MPREGGRRPPSGGPFASDGRACSHRGHVRFLSRSTVSACRPL